MYFSAVLHLKHVPDVQLGLRSLLKPYIALYFTSLYSVALLPGPHPRIASCCRVAVVTLSGSIELLYFIMSVSLTWQLTTKH